MIDSPVVAGVVLAAGMASRMGNRTKQLLEYENKPLLQHVIDQANVSSLDEVVVVLGHFAPEIRTAIEPGRASFVMNECYRKGQSTSVISGIQAVRNDWDGVLMLLGDQPGIPAETIDSLISSFADDPDAIVMPFYRGKRGNPVLLPRRLEAELLTITGDQGARSIIQRDSTVRKVPIDAELPLDVDTLQDWKRLRQ